jgi:hypothetical protein
LLLPPIPDKKAWEFLPKVPVPGMLAYIFSGTPFFTPGGVTDYPAGIITET